MSDTEPLPNPTVPPRRVEIRFEYTLDEIREGLDPREHRGAARRGTKWLRLVAWLVFVLLVALWVLLERETTSSRSPVLLPGQAPGPEIDLYLSLGPSYAAALMIAIILFATILAARLRRQGGVKKREQARIVTMAGVIIAVGGVAWLFQVLSDQKWTVSADSSRALLLALAVAPWFALLVVLILFSKGAARRQFNTRPALRRQRTIVLDDECVTSGDDHATARYRWPYFVKAWETQHVLVLADENNLRHILPKRPFAPPDLETAKSLIVTHIPDSRFIIRPQGFAVSSPGPRQPMPVLPIEADENAPAQRQLEK